jgi:hypothetical protein
MRAPPPVEYPSSFGPAWRGATALLVGAAAGVTCAWALPRVFAERTGLESVALVASPAFQAALASLVGLVAAAAFGCLRRTTSFSERLLRWDGQEWWLPGAGGAPDVPGDVALMLDLGPWMLARFVPHAPAGRAVWLPLTISADLARWAALRGALWNWRTGTRP